MQKKGIKIFTILCLALLLTAPSFAAGKHDHGLFWLTLLHNNDGESQLINAGSGVEDFGGAARFTTVIRKARFQAKFGHKICHRKSRCKMGVITLSSGDNFLAGPEFNASLEKGIPFYDSILVSLIRYDALALGNQEFDFGPDVLEDFISGIWGRAKFLSANLDFSNEPGLQALADDGLIGKAIIIRECGERIGVVGATTENLSFISSPRNVIVNAVALAVQAEIDKLTHRGVNKIVLISHLQSVSVVLDDGTVIIEDGAVETNPPAPNVNIATIDFLARGGDQYPYRDAEFISLGVSYQQALSNIQDGLGGNITTGEYPEGGEGRITELP